VVTCEDTPRLLVARSVGELEEGAASGLDAHLAGCMSCSGVAAGAAALAKELALPADEPGASRWGELAARIESDKKRRGLRVAVGCVYCKDALAREEAVYCAACLAAHHKECFEEHGRCTAPGCGETRFVESRVSGTRPRPRRRRPPRLVVIGLVGAALIGGAAALAPTKPHLHVTRGARGAVDLDVSETRLGAVAAEIARVARVKVVVPPRVALRPVTLLARDHSVRWVLSKLASEASCELEWRDGVYRFVYAPRVLREMVGDAREALTEIATLGDANVVIAPEVSGTVAVGFQVATPWKTALALVARAAGDFEVVEETPTLLRVVPRRAIAPEPRKAPPVPEEARNVTMFLDDTDLNVAIELVGAYAEKKILVPKGLKETVTVELHRVHWLSALRATVRTVGDYEVVDDLVENALVVRNAKTTALVPVQSSRAVASPIEVGLVVRIERTQITVRDSTTERVFVVPPPNGVVDPEVREGILSALGHVELGDRIALEYFIEGTDCAIRALVAGRKWN
jgi:hypothetical protein